MQSSSNLSISPASACKILIVEDEYIIANDLEIILHDAGYPVTGIANSVTKALVLINQQRPDMVLLDIYLKGIETGIDLAKQLEEINIPTALVSRKVSPITSQHSQRHRIFPRSQISPTKTLMFPYQ